MLSRNLLKILWISLLVGFVSVWLLLALVCPSLSPSSRVLQFIALLGAAAWTYLTLRFFLFGRQLTSFLRLLMSGDYDVAIETRSKDELSRLVRILSRLGEQLRTYDKLRAEKVSFTYRALELITRSVSEAVITADLQEREFALNPTAQSLFNVTEASFSLDAIVNQETNRTFVALFEQATRAEKVPTEGEVILQLPTLESERRVLVRILPLKDSEEVVKLAFVFAKLSDAPQPTTVPGK